MLNFAEYGIDLEILGEYSRYAPDEEFVIHEMYLSWRITLKTTPSRREIEDDFMLAKDEDYIEIREITHRFREGVDLKTGDTPRGVVLIEKGRCEFGVPDILPVRSLTTRPC